MDTSVNLDTGNRAGGDTCWLHWHVAPTRDGVATAGQFSIKDAAGRTVIDLAAAPLIFDWPNAKTGWMCSLGVPGTAPEKRWNATRAKFEPQPGDDWRRAFTVPVAYMNGTAHATWEQSSSGSWMGFADLMAMIRATAPAQLPMLPAIVHVGAKRVALGAGSTLVPTFALVHYVDRPDCLPADDAADEPAPAREPAPATRPAAPTYRLPAKPQRSGPLLDDSIPF
jgi:hypothetical protein